MVGNWNYLWFVLCSWKSNSTQLWFSDTNYHDNDGDEGQAIDQVYGGVHSNASRAGIFHDNDMQPKYSFTGSPNYLTHYHFQDAEYSAYMFIFGVDSTLWLTGLADSCGLFASGSNAYRRINNVSRPYAEFVGSRTIIVT